ncbi:MAG: aminopeptidase P family protein [Clostridiales Family XIII bacterium]|jgi:Xaa-Pro aminopeptidase|nr:aminopeptidase P family protein [Clostridiales Family XIII bacterium]
MAQIKTPEEIAALRRAAEAGSAVFAQTLPLIGAGVTERFLAVQMEVFAETLKGYGTYGGLAFPAIIASGPNGAGPHAEPTDRAFEPGDFITIDFGVIIDGYCSDMTRTYLIGEPTDKQREVYGSVLRAQKAGLAAARGGIKCKDLDHVCRSLIEADGYGENFIHTTGHGIGTEVHEDPRIGKDKETILEAGMAVTIEPGIYIKDWGGVRIEDTVILTEDGCEVITASIPTTLNAIG